MSLLPESSTALQLSGIMKVGHIALVKKLIAINRFRLGKMNTLKEYDPE